MFLQFQQQIIGENAVFNSFADTRPVYNVKLFLLVLQERVSYGASR